jgi:hypothetical protein
MISKVEITDIVCPHCLAGDISYANEKELALSKEERQRARPRGWFCGGCRKKFQSPKRVPYNPTMASPGYGVADYKKGNPRRGNRWQNERAKSNSRF